jgi:hypothetical protein
MQKCVWSSELGLQGFGEDGAQIASVACVNLQVNLGGFLATLEMTASSTFDLDQGPRLQTANRKPQTLDPRP